MTDETYTLVETNRERAIIRRSARHKKCGSRNKSCKLGVDKMSNKQIEAQHGEVKIWKLTEFYSYDEFKEMPDDIKVEYINYMLDTYSVGLSTISREVFECDPKTLGMYLTRSGLIDKIRERKHGGNRKSTFERFKQMIKEAREPKEYEKEPEIISDEEVKEPEVSKFVPIEFEPVVQPVQEVNMMTFSTEYFSYGIDRPMLDMIEAMFHGKKLRVSISVEAV